MNKCNFCWFFLKCLSIHPSIKVNVLVGRLSKACIMLCWQPLRKQFMVRSFLSLYVNEVTTVNNQLCNCSLETCACIVYTWAIGWRWDYISKLSHFSTLMKFGGLFMKKNSKCLMCLGTNCAWTFQRVKLELLF
jgi:hypothetical protein